MPDPPGDEALVSGKADREREPRSLRARTVGSALWLFTGAGAQGLLRLAVLTVLARLLGPEHFGLAAAALVVSTFFRNFLQTSVRPALIQRSTIETRHVETGFALALAMGAAGFAVIFAGADWIARVVFPMPDLAPVLKAIALMLPLQALGIVSHALLERDLRFDAVVRIEILGYLIGYGVVGIALAVAGYGVWALVWAYVVNEAICAVAAQIARPHSRMPRVDRVSLREIGYFAWGFLTGAVFNFFALQGDKWVAGRFLGEAALGLYKYAYELTTTIANVFAKVTDQALFPAMARVQDQPEPLGTAYRGAVAVVAAVALPVSAGLWVLAPEIVALVLGPGWEGAIAPFGVLSLVVLFRATYKVSDSLARATGAVYRRAWRQAVYAAAVLGFAMLGQRHGLAGLATGVAVGITLNFLLMADLSTRLAALSWRDIAAAHLGALPCFVVTWGVAAACADLARALGWPVPAVIATCLLATGIALPGLVLAAPRWMLGREGAIALATLTRLGLDRFPRADRIAVLRHLRDAGGSAGR
jgi:PST family polysaccharide transporter